jgi:hypothetical protein
MSLINDALKRAKQSQQQPPPTVPTAPPLPPVEISRGGPSWFLPVAVILLVAVACLFIASAFFINQKPVAQIEPVPPNAPPASAPAVPKMPPAATVQVAAVSAPKPSPPILKVQGIFYNEAKWQAIVNGQSVFVGDSVNGFRVKLISKNDVCFIAPDGTEKNLTLGE